MKVSSSLPLHLVFSSLSSSLLYSFMVLNARKEGKKKQHDEAPDEQGDVLEVLEKECLEEKR